MGEKEKKGWVDIGGMLFIDATPDPGMTDEDYFYTLVRSIVNTCRTSGQRVSRVKYIAEGGVKFELESRPAPVPLVSVAFVEVPDGVKPYNLPVCMCVLVFFYI